MLPPLSIKHGSHLMFMLEQSQFWHEAVVIIPCNMQNRLAHGITTLYQNIISKFADW
jgi:hypothetical protein